MTPTSELAFDFAERLAQRGIHGWIGDRFEGEPRHVRKLLIGEQRRQHRHGLPGADACQFLTGIGFFLQGRVRLENGDEFIFLGEGGAGEQEKGEEECFMACIF